MQGVSNETHRKLQAALQVPDIGGEANVLHVNSAGNCKDC